MIELITKRLVAETVKHLKSLPDQPYLSNSMGSWTTHQLAEEIENVSDLGIDMLKNLLLLTHDLLLRGKRDLLASDEKKALVNEMKYSGDLEDEIDDLQDEVKALNKKISDLEKDRDKWHRYARELSDQLAAERTKNTDLKEVIHDAKNQIEYLHNKFKPTGSGNAVICRLENYIERPNSDDNKIPDEYLKSTESGKLYVDDSYYLSDHFQRKIEKLKASDLYKSLKGNSNIDHPK